MDRRTLGYAAAVLVVFALIVAGALALGGDEEDEPRDAASVTTTNPEGLTATERDRTETQAEQDRGATAEEPEAEPEPEAAPDPAPTPAPAAEPAAYTPFSASSGDWQAELPSGNGWQQPSERQLSGGSRIRVTVRGPDGAALVIDHTPATPARFGSKYRSSRELPQASVGSMTEYRLSENAVGYVLNAGDGGFRIFATGVEGPVARRVADSLTYVDL